MLARLLAHVAASLACFILAGMGAAFAHAVVLSTEPADGSVLAEAPAAIVVRFNEPVSLVAARVLDGSGRELAQPRPASAQDTVLTIALPEGLAEGSYVASYRVVSLDAHPVGGSIVFTVGSGAGPAAGASLASDDEATIDARWRTALVVLLSVFYAGILGSAGCVLFLLAVRPPETASCARIAAGFSLVAIVSAALVTGVEGGYLLDASPEAFFSTEVWRTGFASTLGRSAAVAAVGAILVAAASLRMAHAVSRLAASTGAVLGLASFILTGHVVTAGPSAISGPLLLVHTTAVAYWVGSLLPLAVVLTKLRADAAPLVRRFSRIAVWAVAALVAAGIGIAVLQVGSVPALFGSAYGRTLLLKIALVAVLLLLAALNKLRLTPRLEAGTPGAAETLRASIFAEGVLALVVIVVTAILGTTPPPRVAAGGPLPAAMNEAHATRASGPVLMVHASGAMAMLTFDSASAGANGLTIGLTDLEGVPIEVREVSVVAENPAAGIEPIRRAATARGGGQWRVDGLTLVPAGRWSIEVDALVSDFEQAVFRTEVDLR